jgi:hypothetical protein
MRNPAIPAIFLPIPFLLFLQLFPAFPASAQHTTNRPRQVRDIPTPAGYTRKPLPAGSFGQWLRQVGLRADPVVYLYDGRPKQNQGAQVAVLDIPVGKKDLQQCADACMRLRAEYLLSQGRLPEIEFRDNLNRAYRPGANTGRAAFERYLESVFARCGTLSLEKQLKRIPENSPVEPGDLVIRGGSPGHAVMVVDMAEDSAGRRLYLLAQSYMPAQMIHVLRNPSGSGVSPWYRLQPGDDIRTPEWTFRDAVIRRW